MLIGCYYVTLSLNCKLVSRVKLCLVSVSADIVRDCHNIRNLPKKFGECGPSSVHSGHQQWILSKQ